MVQGFGHGRGTIEASVRPGAMLDDVLDGFQTGAAMELWREIPTEAWGGLESSHSRNLGALETG